MILVEITDCGNLYTLCVGSSSWIIAPYDPRQPAYFTEAKNVPECVLAKVPYIYRLLFLDDV